ncbi:MAG: right-handed parallel beta-helix repeat-containing protein [Pirellulales bacterium]|nr:right-handed parallel beta-helix repeat-containing protein [Pirellulales bacterium]
MGRFRHRAPSGLADRWPGHAARRLVFEHLESRALLTILVTTAADSGFGSLREAIEQANTNSGPDEIRFSLAAGSVIEVKSVLPALADPTGGTTIDGDVNADGLPDIVVHCESFDAIGIVSSDNVIRGLVIQNGWAGVHIHGGGSPADRNCVLGCYIGTDLTGTTTAGTANRGSGVWVGGNTHGTVIGGPGAHEGNVISGNGYHGIQLIGAIDVTVQGNYIGVGADGDAPRGNQATGISLESTCQGVTIGGSAPGAGNVISGSAWNGIVIGVDSGGGNIVQGNRIGTNAAGNVAVANTGSGIIIAGSYNTIRDNVISGNGAEGIKIEGGKATGNLVRGNRIGADATGTVALGNGVIGVSIVNAPGNTIGGTAAGEGNRIAWNGKWGVLVYLAGATENLVRGNEILGNASTGIRVDWANQTFIEDNRITENGGAGISVISDTGGVTIARNLVYQNAGIDVDLGDNGFSPNDPGDEDAGPNALLNWPGLHRASGAAAGWLRIVGAAAPGGTVEFFQTDNLYGCGDARAYLGSVTADAAGGCYLDVPVRPGGVTATVTDAAGNTSEFSMIAPTISATLDAVYLLITNESLAAAFAPLVARRTDQGKPGALVTVEWIDAHYDGARPDGGSDLQTKIRNCIVDYYENHGTRWVCLGGDDSVVPVRLVGPWDGADFYQFPSDFYYAGLEGTWNADADGSYGEAPQDQSDHSYEVNVGRIPVRTADEAAGYIAKVVAYETHPADGFSDSFLYSAYHGDWECTGSARDERYCDHEPLDSSEANVRDLLDSVIRPAWQPVPCDDYSFYHTSWDTSFCGDYVHDWEHNVEVLNKGYHVVYITAHGNPGAVGWMGIDHAEAMTNADRPSIFVTDSCSTGAYDVEYSLSEALIRNPNGGAVAFIGHTRVVWFDSFNDAAILRELSHRESATLGEAMTRAHAWQYPVRQWQDGWRDSYLAISLQGDPALALLGPETGRELQIVSPDGCQRIDAGSTVDIRWNANGAGFAVDEKVRLDYSSDGGAAWQVVPGAEQLPFNACTFAWDTAGATTGTQYRVRVVSLQTPELSAESRRDFSLLDMGLLAVDTVPSSTEFGSTIWISGTAGSHAPYDYSLAVGDPVSLTAPSLAGYNFVAWKDGQGNVVTHQRVCAFTFADDATRVAVYERVGNSRAYFVNDDVAEDGSSPGSDENDGLTPLTPMRHVQAVIDRYADIGTINVAPGVYQENITLTSVDPNVTLVGAGEGLSILDGDRAGSCLHAENAGTVDVHGLTFRNGRALIGGGVCAANSKLTLQHCGFTLNTANYGAGLYCTNSTLDIGDSRFLNNTASGDGGGMNVAHCPQVAIRDCLLEGNSSGGVGGAMRLYRVTEAVVTGNTIRNNWASSHGGGLKPDYGGTLLLFDNLLKDNFAGGNGGGMDAGINTAVTLDSNVFRGNHADGSAGGVMLYDAQQSTVINNRFENNSASVDTGGLSVDAGSTRISENVFEGNSAQRNVGGIAVLHATAEITNNTIVANTAAYDIGGIHFAYNSTGTIADNLIADNVAISGTSSGGGIDLWSSASATIRGNTIRGNSAFATGGIRLRGNSTATIEENTISANRGAILVADGSAQILNNSIMDNLPASGIGTVDLWNANVTIRDNDIHGNEAAFGGGISVRANSQAVIDRNEIVGNRTIAGDGGGVCVENSIAQITRNTILDNCADGFYGGGVALISAAAMLANNVIVANSAAAGAGVAVRGQVNGTPVALVNCTIAANTATYGGGGLTLRDGASLTAANCILYANSAIWGPEVQVRHTASLSLAYCDVAGSSDAVCADSGALLEWLDGNIDASPSVIRAPSDGGDGWGDDPDTPGVDESANDDFGNLRLQSDSPAINAGSNALAVDAQGNPLGTDAIGHPRIAYGTVDMGAYEYLLPGDANLDAVVGKADAAAVAAHWLAREGMSWTEGDFNGDGCTDDLDLAIVAANWGAQFTPPATACVAVPDSAKDKPATQQDLRFVGPRQMTSPAAPQRLVLQRSVPRSETSRDIAAERQPVTQPKIRPSVGPAQDWFLAAAVQSALEGNRPTTSARRILLPRAVDRALATL